jgi:hypothetical protein
VGWKEATCEWVIYPVFMKTPEGVKPVEISDLEMIAELETEWYENESEIWKAMG